MSQPQRVPPVAQFAIASAALLVLLCAMTIASGTSQQWFEVARAPDAYADALTRAGGALRAIVAVDDVFIGAYTTATVLLATWLARGRFAATHVVIVALGVVAGVLDLDENHHILAMQRLASDGVAIPVSEVLRRSELSQLKWLLGHVSFVIVGASIAARDAWTRAFRFSLVAWQLPVGAACWALIDTPWAPVLVWARYASFVAGFAMVAWLTSRDASLDACAEGATSGPA